MLGDAGHYFAARVKQMLQALRYHIERVCGPASENHSIDIWCIHEPRYGLSRFLQCLCRAMCEMMHPPMNVRIIVSVVRDDAISHLLGHLSCCCVV